MNRREPYWRHEDDEESAEVEEFQGRYSSFSDKVERFLMQIVILGLVALALVQTLHANTTARRMLNLVEGLEGVPWNEVTGWNQDRPEAAVPVTARATQPIMLTVVCTTRREVGAKLLVDGKVAGTFSSGTVIAAVQTGQTVSIDGTGISEALTFRVVGPADLLTPALGTSVTTRGNTQTLGVAQLAR